MSGAEDYEGSSRGQQKFLYDEKVAQTASNKYNDDSLKVGWSGSVATWSVVAGRWRAF